MREDVQAVSPVLSDLITIVRDMVQIDPLLVSRQDIRHRDVTIVEHPHPILDEDLPEIGPQHLVVEPRLHLEGRVQERLVALSKFLESCEINILTIQLLELGRHSEDRWVREEESSSKGDRPLGMNILFIFRAVHIFNHIQCLFQVDVPTVIIVVDLKGKEDQRELAQCAIIPLDVSCERRTRTLTN
jgi:hypothetical protein